MPPDPRHGNGNKDDGEVLGYNDGPVRRGSYYGQMQQQQQGQMLQQQPGRHDAGYQAGGERCPYYYGDASSGPAAGYYWNGTEERDGGRGGGGGGGDGGGGDGGGGDGGGGDGGGGQRHWYGMLPAGQDNNAVGVNHGGGWGCYYAQYGGDGIFEAADDNDSRRVPQIGHQQEQQQQQLEEMQQEQVGYGPGVPPCYRYQEDDEAEEEEEEQRQARMEAGIAYSNAAAAAQYQHYHHGGYADAAVLGAVDKNGSAGGSPPSSPASSFDEAPGRAATAPYPPPPPGGGGGGSPCFTAAELKAIAPWRDHLLMRLMASRTAAAAAEEEGGGGGGRQKVRRAAGRRPAGRRGQAKRSACAPQFDLDHVLESGAFDFGSAPGFVGFFPPGSVGYCTLKKSLVQVSERSEVEPGSNSTKAGHLVFGVFIMAPKSHNLEQHCNSCLSHFWPLWRHFK